MARDNDLAPPCQTTRPIQRRAYDSPRRREQAAATRTAILDAALEPFEKQGYAATSVAAIAKQAGVALKTVYTVFGTKRGVLVALRSQLVRGTDDSIPVAQQEWFRTVLDEPDPHKRLAAFADAATTLKSRAGPIFEIIRHAAPANPEIQAMWDQFMRDFDDKQRLVIERFATDGVLKLDVDRATDILDTQPPRRLPPTRPRTRLEQPRLPTLARTNPHTTTTRINRRPALDVAMGARIALGTYAIRDPSAGSSSKT